MRINGNQVLYDRATDAVYIGTAGSGTDTDKAQWSIKKITLDSSGQPTSIKWANGTESPVNIWDDRTSLQYS